MEPAQRENAVAVGVLYREDQEVTEVAEGVYTMAEFDHGRGVMTVFGRCPNGVGQLFSAICEQRGGNYYLNWSHPWAVAFLQHELGHALGVGHDRGDGECAGFPGVMGKPVQYQKGIRSENCAFADYQNCDRATSGCPPDPRTLPPPTVPIADLPNLCDRFPRVCPSPGGGGGGGGGSDPWWTQTETAPDRRCDTTWELICNNFGCEGTLTETCYLVTGTDPVLGGVEDASLGSSLSVGPKVGVSTPASGAFVSGSVQIRGWAADADSGTFGVGFWLDRLPIELIGFQFGESHAICASVPDPNCPNVGFSGTLDTTLLAEGAHQIQVVAVDDSLEKPGVSYLELPLVVDNTRPSVSLSAPAAGSTVSGSVPVTVAASDANGIDVVSFYVDGTYQGSDSSAPYSFTWSSGSWPNGAHTLKALAWDRAGNSRASQVSVTASNDLQTPQVSLIRPAAGSLVRGSIVVEAAASDDQGVSFVELYLDGSLLGTDATAPYRVSWATTAVPDGSHTLTARAYDGGGNAGLAAPVAVTVDNTVPKVRVDSPSHLAVVQGTAVTISGWAIDASGIVARSFKVDGQPVAVSGLATNVNRPGACNNNPDIPDPACPSVGWRADLDSTMFGNGSHTLQVTASDAAGNAKTFERQFVIDNPPVTLQFHPAADATAWQAYPTYNNGTGSTLTTRTTSGGQGAYAFLKFHVAGVGGPVTSARLLVRTLDPMNELWLYWLVHSSWTETGLTWSNFPGPGGELDHHFNLVAGAWYAFDVSSYVTGNGTYSVGFANTNPNYASLWSRESTYAPILEVSYRP